MKKQTVAVIASMLVFGIGISGMLPLHAQTTRSSATTRKPAKAKKETAEQREIRELEEKVEADEQKIQALEQQNASKEATVSTAQSAATAAQSQAAEASLQAQQAAAAAQQAQSAAQSQGDALKTLQNTVADQQGVNATLIDNISTAKADLNEKIDSPAAVHYKGVTITPVAFFAFEGVWRQRALNSDINTPFNSIPMPGANQGHVSELNFSGRQSRLGGLFTGDMGSVKLSGYFEGDFLGAGVTSNNNQSNSYVLRQRQFWGQAAMKSGFTITGGQMWSLVTETGTGTDNRTEKLPATIDPQYMVGFSWTRQPAIRLQQRWGDYKKGATTLAVSLEQAQITNFTAAGTTPTNFFFAGAGQNGGLYNAFNGTYANNVAPDVVVKATYDNSITHLEIGGLARFLRDYYYPVTYGTTTTYASSYTSHTSSAGGAFASARVSPDKYLTLAVQAMGGTGVGRYGSSQLADATLRPDETLEPIKNYHGLLSIETHPTSKFDIFGYYGGEYAQRTVYTTGAGNPIGYGPRNLNDSGCYTPVAPGGGSGTGGSLGATNCSSPTRYIQEGMFGFAYRPYVSAKYGRLQYSLTYQYLQRNLWSGVGSATTPSGPRAEDSMIHWGMRYYIP
jgi:hypothetical protein